MGRNKRPAWYASWKAKLKAEGKWKPRKQFVGDHKSREAERLEMQELYRSRCEEIGK
jgi:hypothetical protein